jgi:hypothetical protein
MSVCELTSFSIRITQNLPSLWYFVWCIFMQTGSNNKRLNICMQYMYAIRGSLTNRPSIHPWSLHTYLPTYLIIYKYACNETNVMHYLSLVYWVSIPRHVSGLLVAHHKKVTIYTCKNFIPTRPTDSRLGRTTRTNCGIHYYLLKMGY